ncbi:Gfo/Idh/MocA family protein [Paenibacillus yanchengensis]|uniref:Gfo/Idh/MocA family protein n=1 Tax=Paenibacillus yanchengensis TaxID=2035833 RepID=A0ABW4YGV4_9BACL
MVEQVRVGFIGTGGMARHHMDILTKIDAVKITAVYDLNKSSAEEVASQYGAQSFNDELQLLDSGLIDALYICTPPSTRGTIEIQAAARGLHLLSEKPVGLQMETVNQVRAAIDQAGIINSSGYCLRYQQNVQKAKQYLADKQVNMVVGYRIGSLPPAKWFAQMHMSGGQLVEQSTHQVDIIRYIIGDFAEAKAVYAQRSIRQIDSEATIPDVGVVSFTMQSGAIGSFINSCVSNYHGRSDIEVYGPDYYLKIDGGTLIIRDAHQQLEETYQTDYYAEQSKAFVAAVRANNQRLVLGSYGDAADTLAATLAFNQAAEQREPVKI